MRRELHALPPGFSQNLEQSTFKRKAALKRPAFFFLLLMPEKICLRRSDKYDKMSAEIPQYDYEQFGE